MPAPPLNVERLYLPNALNNPIVLAITAELAAICSKHEEQLAELMSALALVSSSACKSFGIHPLAFVQNFETVYSITEEPEIPPAPVPGGARG